MAGDVRREDRARRACGAERALRELAVLAPGEEGAPVLELVDVAGRLTAQDLDRVLVADVVGALDGVERVRSRANPPPAFPSAALIPPSAAPEWLRVGMELRDHADVGAGVVCLDRRPHAGAAGTDDEDVVRCFHVDGRYRKSCRSRARSCPVRGTPRVARSRARSALAHARSRMRPGRVPRLPDRGSLPRHAGSLSRIHRGPSAQSSRSAPATSVRLVATRRLLVPFRSRIGPRLGIGGMKLHARV